MPDHRIINNNLVYIFQGLASHDPTSPHVANTRKIGRCGNPGPPNSGSSPSDPGNKMAANPASQYTLPVNAAILSDSRLTSRDVVVDPSSGRHVRNSVAAPSAVLSAIVCPQ